jgi:hypothetical protein
MCIKQRPFILIELFLALALISLSLIPIASYPFKITQKEISVLIEMQLEEISEVAFRDLLLDLSSYIDPETLEPSLDVPQKSYAIRLSDSYSWNYIATWEIECKHPQKTPSSKTLLQATLLLQPEEKTSSFIKLPRPEKIFYEYFIEKKPPSSQREDHGVE